ncbi:hypothetical protein MBLNU459_g4285t2 [Dothideomycetes sp. NU459]
MPRARPSVRAFPKNGGDTLLVLSDRRRYVLRSSQLRDASGLFSHLLEGEGPALSPEGENSGIRFCLALQNYDDETGREILPSWRAAKLTSGGQPARALSVINEGEEHNIAPQLWHSYDMLLAIIYQVDLRMNMQSIVTIVEDCVSLVELAEYLDSMHIVTKHVESVLLSQGQSFYRAIALKPLTWIDLGFRLSSGVIFKEALVHLTGRYNHFANCKPEPDESEGCPGARSLLDLLPGPVREVLDKKHKRVVDMCKNAEKCMMSYYPPNLHRQEVTGRADRDNIGRQSYANDIFSWMALALFRHWLGQSMAEEETCGAEDGGYTFYHLLGTGGMAYLDREQVAGFHQRFPMSAKGKSVLENHMSYVKIEMLEIVKPLLENKAQCIDSTGSVVKWLTCVDVTSADLPWAREDGAWSQRCEARELRRRRAQAAADEQGAELDSDGEEQTRRVSESGRTSPDDSDHDMNWGNAGDAEDEDEELKEEDFEGPEEPDWFSPKRGTEAGQDQDMDGARS